MGTGHVILNKVFSQQTFHELINGKSNNVFSLSLDKYAHKDDNRTYHELISSLYQYLSKYYRNEYFYKNTLINNRLLGRHSLNTTTALAELPINKSKADFVLINGHATVYEIKTELDNFDRLESQLSDYFQVFNKLCVVTSERNVDKLLDILKDTDVGVSVLTQRNYISDRKIPVENNQYLNHTSMFQVLRKHEYESILVSHFGCLPETTPVKYYRTCLYWFKHIELKAAYQYMLSELKKRNIKEKEQFKKVPYELKNLVYFSGFKSQDYKKLHEFLNKTRES